jgi:hypothetical protein
MRFSRFIRINDLNKEHYKNRFSAGLGQSRIVIWLTASQKIKARYVFIRSGEARSELL